MRKMLISHTVWSVFHRKHCFDWC